MKILIQTLIHFPNRRQIRRLRRELAWGKEKVEAREFPIYSLTIGCDIF